ncbi:unnamed protein product [Pseudo-nitzschia multistriata]|uniref:Uncharacterized protein n=1 Tax=Pseudo-nitzschia multistriata TaxID=183589 RepID=A0A448YYU6_9STRA|nr:unnamed protein product [Pseudo-nitzschia multistriata]
MSSAVHLEDLGTLFIVDSYEEPNASQRTRGCRLGIHLRQIGHSPGQNTHGHLISIVEGPLTGLVPGSLHHRL